MGGQAPRPCHRHGLDRPYGLSSAIAWIDLASASSSTLDRPLEGTVQPSLAIWIGHGSTVRFSEATQPPTPSVQPSLDRPWIDLLTDCGSTSPSTLDRPPDRLWVDLLVDFGSTLDRPPDRLRNDFESTSCGSRPQVPSQRKPSPSPSPSLCSWQLLWSWLSLSLCSWASTLRSL